MSEARRSTSLIEFRLQSGLPLLSIMLLLGRDETLRRLSDASQWAEAELALRKEQRDQKS